jgi:hypothetical protein
MSLEDFDGLKASVADFLSRTDLTAVIPTFITLGETQIRRRFAKAEQQGQPIPRKLVVRDDLTLTSGVEYADLPERFIAARSLTVPGDPVTEILYLSPETFAAAQAQLEFETGADPKYYTIIGEQIRLYPIPAQTFTADFVFLQMPEVLSSTVSTNWILADHPDLYLYAALVQSAPYLENDNRLAVWGRLLDNAIDDACDGDPLPKDRAARRIDDLPCGIGARRIFC